jgi:hypothetical protein
MLSEAETMSDGVNVDWKMLKTPDYAGRYENAFEAGRRLASQTRAPNALDPSTPNAPAPPPALSGPARKAAAERAELLGAIGAGLQGAPYAARPSILAHMAPALAARGVAPQTIARFDPTDDNLSAAVTQARAWQGALAEPAEETPVSQPEGD